MLRLVGSSASMVTFDWPPFEGTDLSAVVASGRMASTNNAFATVPVVLASGYYTLPFEGDHLLLGHSKAVQHLDLSRTAGL